jgi:hypothetical protein
MNSHSCSQSLQTHVRTIYHPAIGPLAQHNSSSAYSPSLTAMIDCLHRPRYKLTCFYRNFPIRTQSSNQQESVAKHTRTHAWTRAISKHDWLNQQKSEDNKTRYYRNVCVYCRVRNNAADRSSIWTDALLWRRNNAPLFCYVTVPTSRRQGNFTHVTTHPLAERNFLKWPEMHFSIIITCS